ALLGWRVVLLLGARCARFLRGLLLASTPPVVGGVEPRAAEMNRDGIQHRLDRRGPADGTRLGRRVGDPLENLEDVPVRALVFIGRHENWDASSAIGLDTVENEPVIELTSRSSP